MVLKFDINVLDILLQMRNNLKHSFYKLLFSQFSPRFAYSLLSYIRYLIYDIPRVHDNVEDVVLSILLLLKSRGLCVIYEGMLQKSPDYQLL